jgi:CDP-glycerol glycerophosphotransferase (TagB/SpsB family)
MQIDDASDTARHPPVEAGSAMKFGFWFDYDQTYTFVELYRVLAQRMPGAQATGIVVGDRYLAHAKERLPPGSRVLSFYQLIGEAKSHRPSAEELADFKDFDQQIRLGRVAYSDRFISNFSYDEIISQYVYLIGAFRRYLRDEQPDVVIFPGIISQYTHLFYLIAKDMGVSVLAPYSIGIEDLYAALDNPYFELGHIWELYRSMQQGIDGPTAEERAWAEKFMAKIRKGEAPYPNWAAPIEDRKFKLPGLRQGIAYLANYQRYYRNDFTQATPLSRLRHVLWLRRNRRKSEAYFRDASSLPHDFILFPLQYDPEISTLFLAQYEQTSFIDMIVRQLPLNTPLVVKEHWAMVGQRDWRFFDQLQKKYPNLILVDPRASLNQLARRAKVVVTMSGTIILEALILHRPVVFTSNSRFGGFGLGTFTQNLIDFASALKEAETMTVDDEDLVRMLSSIHRKCDRYLLVEPLGNPETLSESNIAKIANAIESALSEWKTDKRKLALRAL